MASGNNGVADIADRTEKRVCKKDGCTKLSHAKGRKKKEGTNSYTCLCGFHIPAREGKKKDQGPGGREKYIDHMAQCGVLEHAVYDEIERLSEMLGKSPRFNDYKRLAPKNIPSMAWVIKYLGNWSEVLLAVANRNNPDAMLSIDEQINTDPAKRVKFHLQYEALPTNTFAVSSVREVGDETYHMLS